MQTNFNYFLIDNVDLYNYNFENKCYYKNNTGTVGTSYVHPYQSNTVLYFIWHIEHASYLTIFWLKCNRNSYFIRNSIYP